MGKSWKNFERRIAMDIGKWWCDDDESFARSPCSGGWPNKRAEGDVVPIKDISKNFPFCIDAKYREGGGIDGWHIENLILCKACPVIQWWEELKEIGENTNRFPILVTAKKREGPLLFINSVTKSFIEKFCGVTGGKSIECNNIFGTECVYIYLYEEFLQRVKPSSLREILKSTPLGILKY